MAPKKKAKAQTVSFQMDEATRVALAALEGAAAPGTMNVRSSIIRGAIQEKAARTKRS